MMEYIVAVNYLAITFYLLFYLYILKRYPSLMVIFFYFIYGYLSMVVSVFYLDFGGKFAFEVNKVSYHSYSVSLLTLFYTSAFVIFILLFRKELSKKNIALNLYRNVLQNKNWLTPNYIKLYLVFAILFILVIYAHLIYSGIPILLGYGKGQFWLYAKIPFFNVLHNQTSTLLFIAGVLYSYSYQYKEKDHSYLPLKKWFRITLYLYLVYIVLMGYKFGGPLLYLFCFFISTLIIRSVSKGFNIKLIVKYVLIFSAFIIPIILYIYNVILKFGDKAAGLLFDRVFTLQGQVWHFIYNMVDTGDIKPQISQFYNEIFHLLGSVHSSDVGMNYLMQFILPTARLESYIEGGVRLSGGYPANLFVIFDNYLIIAIIHIVMVLIIGLLHLGLFKSIIRFQLVRSLIWFKLAFLSEGYLFMGDLNTVFSKKALIYLIFLTLIYFYEYRKGKIKTV